MEEELMTLDEFKEDMLDEVTKQDMKDYIKEVIKEIVIHKMKVIDLEILLNQAKRELEEMQYG